MAVIDSLADKIIEYDFLIDETEKLRSSRFTVVENTIEIVEKQKNVNTKRSTVGHIKLFKKFLQSQNEYRNPENLEVEKLDKYIAQFILSVRKPSKGKENVSFNDSDMQYEPNSLTAMHSSIHRYLEDKLYSKNIKNDTAFRHSRAVLQSKKKELKGMGKGNLPNASKPFTTEEIKLLFEKTLLGPSKNLIC